VTESSIADERIIPCDTSDFTAAAACDMEVTGRDVTGVGSAVANQRVGLKLRRDREAYSTCRLF
jgi:hypothetical protein